MMFGNGINGGGFQGIGNCFAGGYMHGGFLMLAFLLFATLALLGTLFLVKRSHGNRADSAVMETLRMKLVSGEITEEEYISKKNVLK
jgi:uncharacterized membrane protein